MIRCAGFGGSWRLTDLGARRKAGRGMCFVGDLVAFVLQLPGREIEREGEGESLMRKIERKW